MKTMQQVQFHSTGTVSFFLASLVIAFGISRLLCALNQSSSLYEKYSTLAPVRSLVFGLAACLFNVPLAQVGYIYLHGLGGNWGIISTSLTLTIIATWVFSQLFLTLNSKSNVKVQVLGVVRSVFIAAIWIGLSTGRETGGGSQLASDTLTGLMQLRQDYIINAVIISLSLSIILDVLLGIGNFFLNNHLGKDISEPVPRAYTDKPRHSG